MAVVGNRFKLFQDFLQDFWNSGVELRRYPVLFAWYPVKIHNDGGVSKQFVDFII